jgi:hypothetical protein
VRGAVEQSGHLFSYLSPEQRVPADHPLRAIRTMTDEAWRRLSPRFEALYAKTGRPSIPPEHLLRALLLQVLYERRSNQTHQSTTDPDSRLFKKAKGHEAKLAYLGEVLMENRHGLVVDACVVPATGTGERGAAIGLIAGLPPRRVTVGGDKGYDTRGFVETLRQLDVAPHVALKTKSHTLDRRTTRHGLRHQPARAQTHRRRLRLEEDGRRAP